MFKLTLSPQAANRDTQISAAGFVLTIDGQAIDFTPLGEGEQCETSLPLVGMARRVGGVIEVGMQLQYSTETAEPMQSVNPADYIVEVTAGPVPDVIKRRPVVEIPQLETVDAQAGN